MEIDELEVKKSRLEGELSKSEVFQDASKLKEVNDSYGQLTGALKKAQQKWDELADRIERVEEQIKKES